MAQVGGTFSTYDAVGNREDLSDMIFDISPTETPFFTGARRSRATATKHEWQTDALASADTSNARIEGADATGQTSTATTRVENYTQISYKEVTISGTQESVNSAGRRSEMAYQVAKRGKELKRDVEAILLNNQGYVVGDDATARKLRGLPSWIATNTSRATSGGNATGGAGAADDGTDLRTLTETILKDVIQSGFTNGADFTTIMCGPYNKTVISGFTGRTNARETLMLRSSPSADDVTIIGAASMYASDFGNLRVIPNRFQRERDVFLLDFDFVAYAPLPGRDFVLENLAKTGDAMKRQMVVEYTLEVRNEAALGVCADLNTQAT